MLSRILKIIRVIVNNKNLKGFLKLFSRKNLFGKLSMIEILSSSLIPISIFYGFYFSSSEIKILIEQTRIMSEQIKIMLQQKELDEKEYEPSLDGLYVNSSETGFGGLKKTSDIFNATIIENEAYAAVESINCNDKLCDVYYFRLSNVGKVVANNINIELVVLDVQTGERKNIVEKFAPLSLGETAMMPLFVYIHKDDCQTIDPLLVLYGNGTVCDSYTPQAVYVNKVTYATETGKEIQTLIKYEGMNVNNFKSPSFTNATSTGD